MARSGFIMWALLAVLAAVGGYWWSAGARPAVVQPVNFSHEKHLTAKRESGPITCQTCHKFNRTRTASGRPGVAICAGCHSETPPKSPEMAKLRRFIDQKKEIPWRRVYRVPEHVYYPHNVHVTGAGLKCATCHGPIERQTSALTKPLRRISMDACLDCHRKREVAQGKFALGKIGVDCATCHR